MVETLFYCATFMLVVGAALMSLYAASSNHKRLEQGAEAIGRAAEAGERWREDVRAAGGPLQVEIAGPGGDLQIVRIPCPGGEVIYRQEGDRMIRTDAGGSTELFRVVSSRISRVPTLIITDAWQWELELALGQEAVRVRPLFSFKAVRKGGE